MTGYQARTYFRVLEIHGQHTVMTWVCQYTYDLN